MTAPHEALIVFAGALAGGFVNGLTGFGTGMTALPIWVYALPPLLEAVIRFAPRAQAIARLSDMLGAPVTPGSEHIAVHAALQSEAYPNLNVRPVRRRTIAPTRAFPWELA